MPTKRAPDSGSEPWRRDVASVPPTVLVLGGFLTAPFMYRRLAARLLTRGAAAVVVSQVWLPDWLMATSRGLGTVTQRGFRALAEASVRAVERSHGAPALVVGHSAGGIVARLLTAPEPFLTVRRGTASGIGAIVTLGAPHAVASSGAIGRRLSTVAATVADTSVPGAFYAPRVGYLAVGSRAVLADPRGTGRERLAYPLYRSVLGRAVVVGTEGDGLVPLASTILRGAEHLVLDDALHGPGSAAPWYGSADQIDLWWPRAVEVWREALACRAASGVARADAEAEAAPLDDDADDARDVAEPRDRRWLREAG